MSNAAPLSVIAIDGPVASGKTVLGRRLAERLGWRALDTGVMYRALTWLALERGVDLQDETALTRLAEETKLKVGPPPPASSESATIIVDELDATPHLRSSHVEASVSIVAAVPGVRRRMVQLQREEAQQGRIVMMGRDIGTVVVEEAAVKIYLEASPEVRARRRAAERRAGGATVEEASVLEELDNRDRRDKKRDDSPLRPSKGAQRLNTDDMSIEETVKAALRIAESRLPKELLL